MSIIDIKDVGGLKVEGGKTPPNPYAHNYTDHQKAYLDNKEEVRKMTEKLFCNKKSQQQIDRETKDIMKLVPEGAKLVSYSLNGIDEVTVNQEKGASEPMRIDMNKELTIKPIRDFSKVYKCQGFEITIATDGTVWFLDKRLDTTVWVKMQDAGYPELPQD